MSNSTQALPPPPPCSSGLLDPGSHVVAFTASWQQQAECQQLPYRLPLPLPNAGVRRLSLLCQTHDSPHSAGIVHTTF
jgi:hypothetical protein